MVIYTFTFLHGPRWCRHYIMHSAVLWGCVWVITLGKVFSTGIFLTQQYMEIDLKGFTAFYAHFGELNNCCFFPPLLCNNPFTGRSRVSKRGLHKEKNHLTNILCLCVWEKDNLFNVSSTGGEDKTILCSQLAATQVFFGWICQDILSSNYLK